MNPISNDSSGSCISTEATSADRALPLPLLTTLPPVYFGAKNGRRNSCSPKESILGIINTALAVVNNDTDFYDEHVEQYNTKDGPSQQ
jgi:hypothetical protein